MEAEIGQTGVSNWPTGLARVILLEGGNALYLHVGRDRERNARELVVHVAGPDGHLYETSSGEKAAFTLSWASVRQLVDALGKIELSPPVPWQLPGYQIVAYQDCREPDKPSGQDTCPECGAFWAHLDCPKECPRCCPTCGTDAPDGVGAYTDFPQCWELAQVELYLNEKMRLPPWFALTRWELPDSWRDWCSG